MSEDVYIDPLESLAAKDEDIRTLITSEDDEAREKAAERLLEQAQSLLDDARNQGLIREGAPTDQLVRDEIVQRRPDLIKRALSSAPEEAHQEVPTDPRTITADETPVPRPLDEPSE